MEAGAQAAVEAEVAVEEVEEVVEEEEVEEAVVEEEAVEEEVVEEVVEEVWISSQGVVLGEDTRRIRIHPRCRSRYQCLRYRTQH